MRRPQPGRKRSRKVSGTKAVGSTRRKTRRRSTRKRGIGAVTDIKGMLMKLVGIGGGIILGRVGNNLIVKVAPGFSPIFSGILQAGLGFLVASTAKESFIDDLGDGLMGNGFAVIIVNLASGSPLASIINGPNDRLSYSYMNGPTTRLGVGMNGAQLPAVAGAQLPAVAGVRPIRRSGMGTGQMVG